MIKFIITLINTNIDMGNSFGIIKPVENYAAGRPITYDNRSGSGSRVITRPLQLLRCKNLNTGPPYYY